MRVGIGILVLAFPAAAAMRAAPPQRVARPQRTRSPSSARMAATKVPLFSFASPDSLDSWERLDDVIMGGVSRSRLVHSPASGGSACFEGRLRTEGGGFCGARLKLLAEPLDLSGFDGVYLDCQAGADAERRVWKVSIRTRQDRSETVYQAQFEPTSGLRERFEIPFGDFKLVRGPVLVEGAPPLSASAANATYQISLTVSKFLQSGGTFGREMKALDNFLDGPFSMRLFSLGGYGESGESAARARVAARSGPEALPRALTDSEQAATLPPMVRALRPLLGAVFGEQSRRRRAATLLLKARGTGALGRSRLGWAWRARSLGVGRAALATASVAAREVATAVLGVVLRALFKTIRLISRAAKSLRGGAQRAEASA